MSEPLVLWMFMLLVQQAGLAGGAGADKFACESSRAAMIHEMEDMGQQIISASQCAPVTLIPYKKA
jgi:hypothetical protein